MNEYTGLFISFEGLDGSGKTTQMKRVEAYFRQKGRRVLVTREPGGTALGEQIRSQLLDTGNSNMDPVAELLLYAASRAQHVQQVILPALQQGQVVISDRYADSSVAFQGYGRQLGAELVDRVNQAATFGLMPRLTFILSIPPELSRQRVQARGQALDRIELEKLDFHRRVQQGYEMLAAREPGRVHLLDATETVEALAEKIRLALDRITIS